MSLAIDALQRSQEPDDRPAQPRRRRRCRVCGRYLPSEPNWTYTRVHYGQADEVLPCWMCNNCGQRRI